MKNKNKNKTEIENHRQGNKNNSLIALESTISQKEDFLDFPAISKEVSELIFEDVSGVLKEFYFTINKDDQKKFDKLMSNKDNMKLIGGLLLKLYLKQMEKNKPKSRGYIG